MRRSVTNFSKCWDAIFWHWDAFLLNKHFIKHTFLVAFENLLSEKTASWVDTWILLIFELLFLEKTASQDAGWSHCMRVSERVCVCVRYCECACVCEVLRVCVCVWGTACVCAYSIQTVNVRQALCFRSLYPAHRHHINGTNRMMQNLFQVQVLHWGMLIETLSYIIRINFVLYGI